MGKGKILVVDDENDVRDVIRLQLEQKGFNVLEAVDGKMPSISCSPATIW